MDPDPDNVLALGLTGILTWASVQVLWQLLFISLAIFVAVVVVVVVVVVGIISYVVNLITSLNKFYCLGFLVRMLSESGPCTGSFVLFRCLFTT